MAGVESDRYDSLELFDYGDTYPRKLELGSLAIGKCTGIIESLATEERARLSLVMEQLRARLDSLGIGEGESAYHNFPRRDNGYTKAVAQPVNRVQMIKATGLDARQVIVNIVEPDPGDIGQRILTSRDYHLLGDAINLREGKVRISDRDGGRLREHSHSRPPVIADDDSSLRGFSLLQATEYFPSFPTLLMPDTPVGIVNRHVFVASLLMEDMRLFSRDVTLWADGTE